MWNALAVLSVAVPLLLLPGCGIPLAPWALLDGGSVVLTDKTMEDHAVSFGSGKDCSSVRSEQGLTYCKEDEPKFVPPVVNCYRTLGEVSCYDRPDPYQVNQRTVDSANPPPAQMRR